MDKVLLSTQDISKILKISINTAYRVVRELNAELKNLKNKEDKPYIVFRSKTYSKYFYERYGGKKFLKIKEIEKKFEIKEWEAKEVWQEIKQELLNNGYKVIKGRIPEEFLMQRLFA